ncbi:Pleckstrin homology-like domain [Plasmopara halstedii]|uniref:Pleckstrin homology-like domain n=1 Tax=Plasmopara halstedii TaxID=4781 RepID=A0A0P1B623_PLAHL|nr:Pleckstrin homology-like domain [Plasmopara halstedii]CEG49861.1 Pleckstrin homology-like domain [Plasmopara halstedii]|eukprot:XP_024586230.1 Pleckstrin homology-like domain [Plasmopara halstedii]
MLVNGVDISKLEGYMIKINSKPSFFGKSTSRRWFKVAFNADSDSKKLVISYSTNKNAKDPRGWLDVKDIQSVYCRKEMIEIVSSSRTLRLKGETSVEHRLWSDSLYKLCNPQLNNEVYSLLNTSKDVKEYQKDQEQTNDECDSNADEKIHFKPSIYDSNRKEKEVHYQDSSPQDSDDNETRNLRSMESKEEKRQSCSSFESSHDESEDEDFQNEESVSKLESEANESDSNEDHCDSSRPSTNSSTRSLLVAQIKSGSTSEGSFEQCKNVMSDSEEEDLYENENESPREPATSSTSLLHDDDNQVEPILQSTIQNLDGSEQSPSTASNHDKTFISTIAPDNNFVDDDWDAEDNNVSTKSKNSYSTIAGVHADANFVHDDWDN